MADIIEATTQALNTDLLRLRTLSQNMSNLNTLGYKREVLVDHGFDTLLQLQDGAVRGALDTGNAAANLYTTRDTSAGALVFTKNPLDVALEGQGYLMVRGNNSETAMLTRRGQLQVNAQGMLALRSGEEVMGLSGPIPVSSTADLDIRTNGEIHQNGNVIDRLRIVDVNQPESLQYTGDGLFSSKDVALVEPKQAPLVRQGYLESSNVNNLDEMVRMMEVSRHFEMSHNVLRAYDGMLDSTINVLGNF